MFIKNFVDSGGQPANTKSIIPNSSYLNAINNIQNASENKNSKSKKSNNYFENLFNNTFSPLQDLSQKSSTNPLDVLGAIGNTALNILDVPFQLVGDGLDFAYDNTLGTLTNTQDLFNGDNIRDVLNFGTMAIPGIGLGIRGAKALKNLSNVNKFEKAMQIPNGTSFDNALNTLFGHVAKYGGENYGTSKRNLKWGIEELMGDKGLARGSSHVPGTISPATKDEMRYTKKSNGVGNWKSNSPHGYYTYKHPSGQKIVFSPDEYTAQDYFTDIVRPQAAVKSPVPLYRGGSDISGWFYTPDRRVARSYGNSEGWVRGKLKSTGQNIFENALDTLLDRDPNVIKLPKGTLTFPGITFKQGKGGKKVTSRETFVSPREASSKKKKKG